MTRQKTVLSKSPDICQKVSEPYFSSNIYNCQIASLVIIVALGDRILW